jgi:hypothetical protein
MKEIFRGVIWPRENPETVDGSAAYKYVVVGVLVSDTPINGLDPNETVIDGVVVSASGGMTGMLSKAGKFHPAFKLGDANSVLHSLNEIVGEPMA